MLVPRSLFSDEVIANQLVGLQVKFLEEVTAMHSVSTDFLINNNQESYSKAETPEAQETIINNVSKLKKNQETRINNSEYYMSQIKFLQDVLAQKDGDIEIDTTIKDLIV